MFIQHLAEQGYNIVKAEKKPRKNIQYRDLGIDHLT
jgi:DNA-directed RNA polymerase I subunit RPA43